MHLFFLAFQCIYGCSDEGGEEGVGRRGVIFLQEESKWRLLGLLYAEVYKRPCVMRPMVGRFVEVCRRRELKINADKTKVMVLNGED